MARGNWYLERNAMKKHLLTLLMSATAMLAVPSARAQNVVATHDSDGHPLFTDKQDDARPTPHSQPSTTSGPGDSTAGMSSRYSGLVYWSSKEHRWKPVPLYNTSTMKAARQAAREVDHLVAAGPRPTTITGRTRVGSQPVLPGAPLERQLSPAEVDKAIEEAAQRHGVDANLVRAVVKV